MRLRCSYQYILILIKGNFIFFTCLRGGGVIFDVQQQQQQQHPTNHPSPTLTVSLAAAVITQDRNLEISK